MTNHSRPNYFLLLGIDPDVPWEGAAFETLLRVKHAEWCRNVSNTVKTSKAAVTAQAGLDHHDNIKRVMADRVSREREAADARRRLAEDRVRRRADLERDLRIMLSKGFIWDVEVAALPRNYPEIRTDPELADRIDHLPTRVIAEQYPVPAQLEQSKANRIRGLLDSIGEKSLYTVLTEVDPDIDEHSGLDELFSAADELYHLVRKFGGTQDTRLNAKLELAGDAVHVFKTAQERARYDNTRALAPVVALIAKYQAALAPIKRFEADQVDRFRTEAAAADVPANVALALLLKHFTALNWAISLPASVTEPAEGEQERCGACQARNDTENEFCVVCGARLRITCPTCDRTVSGHGACGRCGFPVGDYDWAALLARDCADLVGRRDLAGAEEKLKAAKQAWPSEGEDELALLLRERGEQVRRLRDEQAAEDERTAEQLRGLSEARNFHAARNRADNARATVANRDLVVREADEHISAADRCCDLAERAASTRERLDLYTKALAHCADHKRAELALSALPPEPPRDLRVESTGSVVRLSWTPSDTDNVRYFVVRKAGVVPPISPADGSWLATVRGSSHDDSAPEPGLPLWYAVFAQRPTGISAEHGATTTEPVFVTEPVTVTSQRTDDGVVELGWQLPAHATGVLVQRTANGTTTEVSAEPTRLREEGLVNGVSHTYGLCASYPTQEGTPRLSTGVSVSLTPGRPPATPGPVHVHTVTRNLGLCYRLVDLMTSGATVLWTQQRPPIRPGAQYPVTELADYGSLLNETAVRSLALPRAGLYYFVPAVIEHGVGYLGAIRCYAAREEVTELAARDLGVAIRLTWTWPEDCHAALVSYGHDDWPADPTVAPQQELVERDGESRTAWYDVPRTKSTRDQKFFFVVASAERSDDEVFVAGGSRCLAQPSAGKLGIRKAGKGSVSH